MSIQEISINADTDHSHEGVSPDRRLGCSDTAAVALAPAPGSLPKFVLGTDGSVPNWGEASERFVSRLRADSPYDARFTGEWATRARARLLRADERMREWCETTALLTFTGSPYLTSNSTSPMPPTSFVSALKASRGPRRQKLRAVLDDAEGRWITLRCAGAHESGYPHEHLLVGSEAELSAVEFEPVVSAHREQSPVASHGAHGAGAISLESDPNTNRPTGGVQYVAPDVPGVRSVLEADGSTQTANGVVDESQNRIRMATVLEATGTQAVRIDSSGDVDADWF